MNQGFNQIRFKIGFLFLDKEYCLLFELSLVNLRECLACLLICALARTLEYAEEDRHAPQLACRMQV